MLRILMAVFLTVMAASGCSLGLHSAIDAAPFEARMAAPPFRDGVYCRLTKDDGGELRVPGQSGENANECSSFSWDAARRLSVQRDAEGNEKELKLVDLGDGFFMMQLPATYGDDDRPFAFTLWAGVAKSDAFVIIPISYGEELAPVGARHPGVTFSIYKPPQQSPPEPAQTPDGLKVEPLVDNPDVFYISAGAPADIRDLVRDIIDAGLKMNAPPPEEARKWKGEGMMVRDVPSQADHPPSAAQQREIDAIVGKLLAHLPPGR